MKTPSRKSLPHALRRAQELHSLLEKQAVPETQRLWDEQYQSDWNLTQTSEMTTPTPWSHKTVDGFFDPAFFAWARQYFDRAPFLDEQSPVDGVTYPLICRLDHKPMFYQAVSYALYRALGNDIKIDYLFARLSPANVPCPHQAHTDESMGKRSLMVYMNRPEHCQGGTELLRHNELGFSTGPCTEEMERVVLRDQNTPAAWTAVHTCPMASNRGFIFDSKLFHRAAPIGGFGGRQDHARLVLTCFFSEVA